MNDFIAISFPSLPFNESMKYERSIQNELKESNFSIYGVMVIDDPVDLNILDKKTYLECRDAVEALWNGKSPKIRGLRQTAFLEHAKKLKELHNAGNSMAQPLFERWKEALELGYEDSSRKNRVLYRRELDELNQRIGENLVASALYFGFPEIGQEKLDEIAKEWGRYAKIADNFTDLWEDIFRCQYINVPAEEIENLKGLKIEGNLVKGVDCLGLAIRKQYVLEKIQIIQDGFGRSEKLFMKAYQKAGVNKKERLELFLNYAHSWPLEVKRVFNLSEERK
jgi:hypothetical protein